MIMSFFNSDDGGLPHIQPNSTPVRNYTMSRRKIRDTLTVTKNAYVLGNKQQLGTKASVNEDGIVYMPYEGSVDITIPSSPPAAFSSLNMITIINPSITQDTRLSVIGLNDFMGGLTGISYVSPGKAVVNGTAMMGTIRVIVNN